jgi:hypothetical protein
VEVSASGLKWLVSDTNSLATGVGSMLGDTFYSIEATAAAGDLSWDIYVEYDIEFADAWLPAGIDLKSSTLRKETATAVTSDETIRKLLEEIQRLKKAVGSTPS